MRIAVLANDLVPGMGLPVAAPGLRAWGLALGLRDLGHEVTVVVDQWLVDVVWKEPMSPPLPRGAMVLKPGLLPAWVRAHGIDVLVITNSNHIDNIGDLGSCRIVYDFFAPKMLELAENLDRSDRDDALERLEQRKLRALGRSSLVIVNGEKKLSYVHDWMSRAGVPDLPCAVVNPGLPPVEPRPADAERLQVIVSGYIQPWSRPGAWVDAVLPLLDEGLADLHLVVGNHWAPGSRDAVASDQVERLAKHPRVVRHPLLGFDDFRALLSRCHLSIDVFERNPERELAMVTRTVVALSSGLPVMHVDFTEVSPWIAEHDAGWLVDEQDAPSMERELRTVATDRSVLAAKRAGAVEVSRTILRPRVAAEPLHQMLAEVR
ncbi:hypothetical protein ABFT23_15690 [Nocardioides sp. C4-1]|uniref:hypothetical protein n=1 Tax=Nocardioides sp. C4-1 TaxID=3151851 RepID=UPI0032666785